MTPNQPELGTCDVVFTSHAYEPAECKNWKPLAPAKPESAESTGGCPCSCNPFCGCACHAQREQEVARATKQRCLDIVRNYSENVCNDLEPGQHVKAACGFIIEAIKAAFAKEGM